MLISLDQNGKQPVNPFCGGVTRTKRCRQKGGFAERKPTVREAEGGEGMRLWKKRRLPCNGVDRG